MRNTGYWCALGQVLGTSNYHDEAIYCFRKAIDIDSNHYASIANLSVSLNVTGNHEEALKLIDSVPDGTCRKEGIKANILQSLDQHDQAIPLFELAISIEPDFYLSYLNLINSLIKIGNPSSEYWFKKAIKKFPRSPEIAFSYCEFLLNSNRLEELVDANWIDNLESDDDRLDIIGRNDTAQFLIILSKLYRLAAIAIHTKKKENIEKALELLSPISKGVNCRIARYLAVTSTTIGQTDLLIKTYNQMCEPCQIHGIEIDQNEGTNFIPSSLDTMIACSYHFANKPKKCVEYCEKAIKNQPENPILLDVYWDNLDELNKTQEAIKIAEKLYQIRPEKPNLAYNIGYLYKKNGENGKAKYYYNEQIEKQKNHFNAHENLIFIYLLEQNFSKAENEWRLYKKNIKNQSFFPISEKKELSEFIRKKEVKFYQLIKFAKKIKCKLSYALDLIEFNEKTEPLIGSETRIFSSGINVTEILSLIDHPDKLQIAEVKFKESLLKRGDTSYLISVLKTSIPNWKYIPEEAQYSLIQAEKNMNESRRIDYSPDIVLYAKAVEISLNKIIFESYKKKCLVIYNIEDHIKIALSDKFQRTHNFIHYIEKNKHLELGSMAFTLHLCTGKTANKLFLLGYLRDYIINELKLDEILSKGILSNLDLLASKYRNPAAHSLVFNKDDANSVRKISLNLLNVISKIPPSK